MLSAFRSLRQLHISLEDFTERPSPDSDHYQGFYDTSESDTESESDVEITAVRTKLAISGFIHDVARRCKKIVSIYLEHRTDMDETNQHSTVTRSWIRQEGSQDEWVEQLDVHTKDILPFSHYESTASY